MFRLLRPSSVRIAQFLADQQQAEFSYAEVGASKRMPVDPTSLLAPDASPTDLSSTYNIDHNRVQLGTGQVAFDRAKQAIRAWKMFDLGWCNIHPLDASLQVGVVVAAVVQHFGFWSLNASRIVYLLDEERDDACWFGFAYGTLREHSEIGEERFSVVWNRADNTVWYDLLAFSRPNHPLARLAYPLARRLQRRFAHDSKAAMVRGTRFAP